MTIPELNELGEEKFIEALGWIFEHSPWVAQRAFAKKPFPNLEALHVAMVEEVNRASRPEQIDLIKAHPDLGTRAKMTSVSTAEQSGVGLDSLTSSEFAELTQLNSAYREKFDFPFIFAVKGSTKYDIIEALRKRLREDPEKEFHTALDQIYRIAWFRLSGAIGN